MADADPRGSSAGYEHAGPFATAYVDATRAAERGAEEVRLRWLGLRTVLAAGGAGEATLLAMDDAVAADRTPGEHGRVLVGAGGDTVLDAALPRAPIRPQARWAPLPHLMPYLAQLGPRIAHVVVVADRAGADVFAATAATAAAETPSTADWSERHVQQRVESDWAGNARQVAAVVAGLLARVEAGLVIVAGDGRARARLRVDLAQVLPPGTDVVDVPEGGRHNGVTDAELLDAVHGVLVHRDVRERERTLGRLREGQGHGLAVQGLGPVIDALRHAQVDTLVLVDKPSSRVHAWIGPEPTQFARDADELHDLGVDTPQPDRLDSAMVRALAGTSAALLTVPPDDLSLPDGMAALLR